MPAMPTLAFTFQDDKHTNSTASHEHDARNIDDAFVATNIKLCTFLW